MGEGALTQEDIDMLLHGRIGPAFRAIAESVQRDSMEEDMIDPIEKVDSRMKCLEGFTKSESRREGIDPSEELPPF